MGLADDRSPAPLFVLAAGMVVLLVGAGLALGVGGVGETDSDADGLTDARERDLGTDPRNPDTDGDRLLDGWEVRNESADGVPLPGADPLRKDLYVLVSHGENVSSLSAAERRRLRQIWATMRVDNPGNDTGVTVHLRDRPGSLGSRARLDGTETRTELLSGLYSDELLGERRCVYHHLVLARIDTEDTLGYAETPGYLAVVDGTRTPAATETTDRVDYVVHELLHTVAGELDDGSDHVDRGWLATHVSSPGWERRLAPVTRRSLADGFAPGRSAETCGE